MSMPQPNLSAPRRVAVSGHTDQRQTDQRVGMAINPQSADTLQSLRALIEELECVVQDGTWFERFLDERLLDPATAAQVAKAAVIDREYGEVLEPVGVLEALVSVEGIPKVAFAGALREVWLDYGLNVDDQALLASIFRDASEHGSEALMTAEELEHVQNLPPMVDIFRGQMFRDGRRPSNISWSLNKEVAGWYAAPVPSQDQPQGWVLSSRVPRVLILAYFLERGEQEVIVDPSLFRYGDFPLRAERGTCDTFPEHLARGRMARG